LEREREGERKVVSLSDIRRTSSFLPPLALSPPFAFCISRSVDDWLRFAVSSSEMRDIDQDCSRAVMPFEGGFVAVLNRSSAGCGSFVLVEKTDKRSLDTGKKTYGHVYEGDLVVDRII
jgi:hypothetical protein